MTNLDDEMGWKLSNTYAELPRVFYTRVIPTSVADPQAVIFNRTLAEDLGLDVSGLIPGIGGYFSGNYLPPGSNPIAQAYAGHQYGNFTQLGDGRAILLGEQLTPDGILVDIQLKGSGQTPYSRRGDGRAALGPMLREYIVSEAMYGLGIPTTRSLAVVRTGEDVLRQDGYEPGGILTRVAGSHIRVGTFEWAAAAGGPEATLALVKYTLARHFPDDANSEAPSRLLLSRVVERQADLIAKWMLVGFVHGVMNTDNMAISGETIDYGPCAFMDTYHPDTVFSSIDLRGRYAYGNQPSVAQWNLARFAESLLAVIDPSEEKAIEIATLEIEKFVELYQTSWLKGMRGKLGLISEEPGDFELISGLLSLMRDARLDFTNTFAALDPSPEHKPGDGDASLLGEWRRSWLHRLSRQSSTTDECRAVMRANNPAIIPRNHLVEEAISAAVAGEDALMTDLLKVLERPYGDEADIPAKYRHPAPEGTPKYVTYCGT